MQNWISEHWYWISIAVWALFFIVGIVIYNRLVALRQGAKQAFADIDAQLKARADLIPNLVNTVKAYAKHEGETLVQLSAARSATQAATTTGQASMADSLMGAALGRLMVVAEAYPELKANDNFMHLQHELADIENKIAAARRYLNAVVAEYNGSIQQFPAVAVAKFFNFGAEEMYNLGPNRADFDQAPVAAF